MKYDAALRRRTLFALGGMGLLTAVVFVLVQFQATLVFTVFLYYASRPIYRKLEIGDMRNRVFHFRIDDPDEFDRDLLRFGQSYFSSV